MEKISNELNQFMLIILIFLIVFRDNIDLLKQKYIYYMMCIFFVISIFIFNNEPGILLLYSYLFILVWYEHNITIKNKQ
jgi:hypothetical protein